MTGIELGIYSFGERTREGGTGAMITPERRMANLIDEIERADEAGLEVFGVGEHHRPDYMVSAPAVVLAAAAARTRRIRLTSAVSVLSSDDPVRVFQQFATVDLISGGRAEIMAGRGSFTESFPLFGYDLSDYDSLFREKLELLIALRDAERVSWAGRHRAPLENQAVYPQPLQDPIPVWLAVGGTPGSAARAGDLGLPMALGIIGGEPARFAPLAVLFRERWMEAGHDPAACRLSINAHGWVADDGARAREEAWPPYRDTMGRIGRERGWPPPSRERFEAECGPRGALLVGSPDEVADKLIAQHALFDYDRYLIQLTVGTMPHDRVVHSIGLLGNEVAPRVRDAVGA